MGSQVYVAGLEKGLKKRNERIEELEALLQEVHDWLTRAPFDYSNGVTYNGVDEGDVRGWDAHNVLVKKIKEALGEVQ